MKHVLLIFIVAFAINANAQTRGKWSAGVGYTPSIQNGSTFALYINRHFGEKWQIGFIPFGWHDKYSSSSVTTANSTSLGLNISSRYKPIQLNMFKPYIYGFAGFGHTTTKYTSSYSTLDDSTNDYLNFSIGVGTELSIRNGWSVDTNLGYLRLEHFDNGGGGYTNSPIFSVGVLKRFGKVKE